MLHRRCCLTRAAIERPHPLVSSFQQIAGHSDRGADAIAQSSTGIQRSLRPTRTAAVVAMEDDNQSQPQPQQLAMSATRKSSWESQHPQAQKQANARQQRAQSLCPPSPSPRTPRGAVIHIRMLMHRPSASCTALVASSVSFLQSPTRQQQRSQPLSVVRSLDQPQQPAHSNMPAARTSSGHTLLTSTLVRA